MLHNKPIKMCSNNTEITWANSMPGFKILQAPLLLFWRQSSGQQRAALLCGIFGAGILARRVPQKRIVISRNFPRWCGVAFDNKCGASGRRNYGRFSAPSGSWRATDIISQNQGIGHRRCAGVSCARLFEYFVDISAFYILKTNTFTIKKSINGIQNSIKH